MTLEYYLWREEGRLETASAEFVVAGVVPMSGLAADRDLVPEYPGITTSERLADWDPPFPIDLGRVRPVDEEYWARHRATPKAFVPLAAGQELWSHRLGRVTSVRVAGSDAVHVAAPPCARRLDPLALGLTVDPVRDRALASAEGATDFGEYFTYFSFFLVVAALLLAVLFFRLGLERRAAELGLLRALGFTPGALRRVHLAEAAVLAVVGAALGAAGAAAWAALLVTALRTWWIGAVGTDAITLHLAAMPIALGAAGVAACALAAAAWTLRDLGRVSPRALLAGEVRPAFRVASARWTVPVVLLGLAAVAGRRDRARGHSSCGRLLRQRRSAPRRRALRDADAAAPGAAANVPSGATGIARLGWRGARHRPGGAWPASPSSPLPRSWWCRWARSAATPGTTPAPAATRSSRSRSSPSTTTSPRWRAGRRRGWTRSGRCDGWPASTSKEGDDASCLNLYRPANPRVIAPERRFLDAGRLPLPALAGRHRRGEGEPVAAAGEGRAGRAGAGDRGRGLDGVRAAQEGGGRVTLDRPARNPSAAPRGRARGQRVPVRAGHGGGRIQAAVPRRAGYRLLLVDDRARRRGRLVTRLESALADQGLDVVAARDRLAAFHRVENTYLSTFQALGGLGLLLGTVGLGTLLFRNALERRREIALLRAVGYRPGQVSAMLVAENAALLALGVGAGIVAALAAVVPAAQRTGGGVPLDVAGRGGGRPCSSPASSPPRSRPRWCGARRCVPALRSE